MHAVMKFTLSVYICLLYSMIHHSAVHAQTEEADTSPVLEQSGASVLQEPVEAQTASEQSVSYDDVYGIELELSFAGGVEVNAVDGDEIIIRLEKQGKGIDENTVKTYLDTVKLLSSKVDDILLLKPQLPEDSDSRAILTRINCFIETPPDISVKIKTEEGNIRVQRIRGAMEVTTNIGHVHFSETMGKYRVNVMEGRIYGRILLTSGDNFFKTHAGSIDLVVLDEVASPIDLTAVDGGIRLRLPENFMAEVEIKSENNDQRAIKIELPAEIERTFVGDVVRGWINDGGPLIRLNASDQITILPTDSVSQSRDAEPDTDAPIDEMPLETEDSIPLPTVDVPKAAVSPMIDGNLFEKAWSKAVPLQPFYQTNGLDPPGEPTQAFLMWDEGYLYIGIRAYDSQMKRVRLSQTKRDSSVWSDDALEVLVDPNPQTPIYYHLIVNPIGAVFDQIVKSDYPPDSRFAPIDGPSKHLNTFQSNGIADRKWNSQAQIKTQITSTFWSVEIALPRGGLESASGDEWRFNLHRKLQRRREYSYWSPTYDENTPWWPHWREAMGILHLTQPESAENTQARDFEEKLELAAIELHGNTAIPTPEILQLIPFEPGDIFSISELSWLNGELEDHSWFRKVRLETAEVISANDEIHSESSGNPEVPVFKVIVRIHVVELPTRDVEALDLRMSQYLREDTLRALFGLKPGRSSIEDLGTKCQLITTLYRNHGYQLATTNYHFVGDDLLIDIDEGHLDEIRFSGNKRIKTAKLIDAFDFKRGDAYNQTRGELLIDQMDTKLKMNSPYFKEVKGWRVKREGDKNVLEIEVKERSSVNWKLFPRFSFNRVHGLILGGSGEGLTKEYGGGHIIGGLSYGFSSSIWNYQLGTEKGWFDRHTVSIGGGIYKLTDTNDYSTLSPDEELLTAVVLGDEFLDYYQRTGYQAWVKGQLTPSTGITFEFTDEEHETLFKSTDWSVLNKNTPKQGNLRIHGGDLRTFSVSYDFDSRNHKSHRRRYFQTYPSPNNRTTHGWQGNFAVEYAGKQLQSDFDFTLYRFRISRYNRLSNNHYLDFRLMGGLSDAPLPRQRLFYLGGIGTLRGYSFKEFAGDNMLLFNVEYRFRFFRFPEADAVATTTVFLDTGYTWYDDETDALKRFYKRSYTSVGVGASLDLGASADTVQADTVRIEIARALREGRKIRLILRLARMF